MSFSVAAGGEAMNPDCRVEIPLIASNPDSEHNASEGVRISKSAGDLCHILFIIDQLCEAGGAERVLLNTIRLLPKDRFRCTLLTFKIDPTVELFQNLPCRHFVFPLKKTYDWNAIRVARKIRELIRNENVRIVHTFFETSDLWAGFISKTASSVKVISSRRDMGILRSAKHDIGYRFLSPLFDLVLTVSDEVRRFCIKKDRLAPNKVATLYNGLDLGKIPELPSDIRSTIGKVGTSCPLIVTVGHVRHVKGIDVLLETVPRVLREFPNAIFLIIGRNCEAAYFSQLESRIIELEIEANVCFLGETENIMAILRACDIFFLPSRSEGFSNALIEAMACGLPCIATRVGGNAEAIDEGRSGYLFESEDSETAASRIISLLRDPALARKMSGAGREIVEQRFTESQMIESLVGHYKRLSGDA
jgi:glycosyltransferase involved in cell wall biosynthesis